MDKPVVEVETTIAAGPKTVWAAMTRKKSAMFPGTEVETDWTEGHPITFSGDWKGKAFKDRGEIQTVMENRELSFTHWSELSGQPDRPENYHIVRYVLVPQGDSTRVTLSQINKGTARIDEKTRAEFAKNWSMMLDSLKQDVERH